eukprot:3925358-Prymnesium_polylepis.1
MAAMTEENSLRNSCRERELCRCASLAAASAAPAGLSAAIPRRYTTVTVGRFQSTRGATPRTKALR